MKRIINMENHEFDNLSLNFKKVSAGFLLFTFCLQFFALPVTAQKVKNSDVDRELDFYGQTVKHKVSPDLEEKTFEQFHSLRGDEMQKVIIQLKPETPLNEMFGNNLSKTEQDALFAEEVRNNRVKTGIVSSKLVRVGGNLKKSYNNIGLLSAELPLSKIRELTENNEIAYISPDRTINSNGHLETTTGTAQIRNMISGGSQIDGTGVGIAILDSGIEFFHGSFSDSTGYTVAHQQAFVPTNENDLTYDLYGHGTHVATMAAGRASFSSGYYTGVAPGAKIINLKVLDNNGRGLSSTLIEAIDWMIANKATHNIRVANMSLGTGVRDSYINDPLCQAARRAVNAGIVVVASAGNYGKDANGNKVYGGINSPGIEPSVITVGAVNTYGTEIRSDDTVASFSSRGPTRGYKTLSNGARKYDNLIKPDIVAPGNRLIGASAIGMNTGTGGYYPNKLVTNYSSLNVWNNYSTIQIGYQPGEVTGTMRLSGTSMAAPVVSGAAALMIQLRPNLTPNLVKAILMYSAQPLRNYNTLEQGAGQLNVDGAIRITELVKKRFTPSNGSSILSATLPNPQASTIAGETCYWGKGVITNFGFLYGDDLMNKWQGMYASGVIMGDGTPFSGSSLTKSTSLTSGTLTLYQGAIKNNGVIMGDGTLYLSSNAMGGSPTPYVNSQGVLISDGVIMGDGVVMGDGVIMGDGNPTATQALLGEDTPAMTPAP